MKAKTLLRWGISLAMAASVAAVVGCAPSVSETQSAGGDASSSSGLVSGIPETDPMQPVIKQLSDGTLIQRTPTEDVSIAETAEGIWHHPDENVPANTYFTNADARGCNACHEDLAATVDSMPYGHLKMSNELGIEITVQQCMTCHRGEGGMMTQTIMGEFGTWIHGAHMDTNAECWSCHDSSSNTDGEVVLWDFVKHNKLRGITDIAATDMGDGFSFSTDMVIDPDEAFDLHWEHNPNDYERADHVEAGDETPEELFDTWTITVSGMVDEEKTFTLPELIAEAEAAGVVETFIMKAQCNENGIGGPWIGQYECTGIPMSWILEQVDIAEGAEFIEVFDPGRSMATDAIADIMAEDACEYLVYEMSGERLGWRNGYPVCIMRGDETAYANIKQPVELKVTDVRTWKDDTGWAHAKPNVSFFDLHEGQIIKTGETFTFTGYVDAWNETVTALEISMDRGKTWKSFPIEAPDVSRLVTWSYDFTPTADRAYCIAIRGVSESGSVTQEYVEKMVVAKSEIPVVE